MAVNLRGPFPFARMALLLMRRQKGVGAVAADPPGQHQDWPAGVDPDDGESLATLKSTSYFPFLHLVIWACSKMTSQAIINLNQLIFEECNDVRRCPNYRKRFVHPP